MSERELTAEWKQLRAKVTDEEWADYVYAEELLTKYLTLMDRLAAGETVLCEKCGEPIVASPSGWTCCEKRCTAWHSHF